MLNNAIITGMLDSHEAVFVCLSASCAFKKIKIGTKVRIYKAGRLMDDQIENLPPKESNNKN